MDIDLIYDTETTGFPLKTVSPGDQKQPAVIQLAFSLSTAPQPGDEGPTILVEFCAILQTGNKPINPGALKIHGISQSMAAMGLHPLLVIDLFADCLNRADTLIAHNLAFDKSMMQILLSTNGACANTQRRFQNMPAYFCTMLKSMDILRLPGRFNNYKWPKLIELYRYLFNEDFEGVHDALCDVRATRRCYYELLKRYPHLCGKR